ncbi:MAG TPA: VWA domain-containing protein [Bryobacteraceae bacterium]|nr:VWA domain-containing protein [Bryobacteraceae bacterium]
MGLLAQQVAIQPKQRPEAKGPAMPSANLRVDTNLVLVPTTVNDDFNRPVTGLEKGDFRLFEDKVEQTITSFSSEDEPIALGFIFDTSGSMAALLPQGRDAASEFLKMANPEDEFFLVEFDNKPRLVIPLSSNTSEIGLQVAMTKSGGSTALIDGLFMGIHEMHKSKKTKKALVLISDGGENNSRYSPGEIKNAIKESDVLIYTVAIAGGFNPDSAAGLELLNGIAEMSGAHMFNAGGNSLADIAEKIGVELRNRYVLGYTPRDVKRDGKFHKIQVKVVPPRGLPKLQAHWRSGYYAPSN